MSIGLGKSVKHVAQLMSANMSTKLISFIALAFYTRYLPKDELAVIPIFMMLGPMAAVFFGFGIQPNILKLLPSKFEKDKHDALGLAYTSIAILLSGSLVFALGVYVLADRLAPVLFRAEGYTGYVKIMALGCFFFSVNNMLYYLLWSSSRFSRISIIRIVQATGQAVLGAGLLLLGGLKGLVIGLTINELICVLLSLYYTRDLFFHKNVTLYSARRLVRNSLPFYFESFLIYFRTQGDNWIIVSALGPGALAVYFVAKRIPQVLFTLRGSVDSVITTEVSRRAQDLDELSQFMPRLQLLIYHAVTPPTFLIIGIMPALMLIVGGGAYESAVVPSMILCSVQLLQFYQIPASRGVFVLRSPMSRVSITIAESVVLITSLLFLAPRFAVVGVTISLLLATCVSWVVSTALFRRALGSPMHWNQLLRTLLASGVMVGAMIALQGVYGSLLAAAAIAVAGIVIFLVVVSVTNSREFYKALSFALPFDIFDPVRYVVGLVSPRARG